MSLSAQIESVQPDVFFKLLSEASFAPVSVFLRREKRLTTQIADSLSGLSTIASTPGFRPGTARGLVVEVLMPELRAPLPNTTATICTLAQKFLVKEQPTINLGSSGTGVSAEQWAVSLAQTFQLFFLGGPLQGFYPAPVFYKYEDTGPESPFLQLAVELNATFALTALTRTIGPAAAAVNNNNGTDTVTLTDQMPGGGSVIYYTTDGSFPGPGNLAGAPSAGHLQGTCTATIYSGPFTVNTGTQVRTAAYNGTLQGSMIDTFNAT